VEGLRLLVEDRLEQARHGVLNERLLQASHMIHRHSQRPDIRPLIIVFIFDDFWG